MPPATEGSTPSNSTMTEKPANKVRGFLLYSPTSGRHFFRVYGEVDPATGRKTFTDYKICAEDVEVTIETTTLSLFEGEEGVNEVMAPSGANYKTLRMERFNRLDWSSKYLGKNV